MLHVDFEMPVVNQAAIQLEKLQRATEALANRVRDYQEKNDPTHIPAILKRQAG